jgi:hypothetical protein
MDENIFDGISKIVYAIFAAVVLLLLAIGIAGGYLLSSCDHKAKEQREHHNL